MGKYFFGALVFAVVIGIFVLTRIRPSGFGYNNSGLEQNLQNAGLEKLAMEGNVLHVHQHLDLNILGKTVTVPAGIGIGPAEMYFSPIHVHDTTGIIHVESPTFKTFTLGQFFQVWGIQFNDQCIGIYCNDPKNKLQVFVNGELIKENVTNIELRAHQEIAIYFGDEVPIEKVIKSYNFLSDL